MSSEYPLLDHGYVKLIETWGSDERVIESARMSTDKGFLGWGSEEKPGDERLLRFLWSNKHATPFEMAGATFEIKAPIFVFREWHRHRTQSYNEMSARYTALPDENYMPTLTRLMIGNDGKNKQAGTIAGAAVLTSENAVEFQKRLGDLYKEQQNFYEWALSIGIPKELARIDLPVGRYSKMRASANLRNWLAFLALREPSSAQWEIRQAAISVHALLGEHFPRTIGLFEETLVG
jgi:thymidylate synthase (FAD)